MTVAPRPAARYLDSLAELGCQLTVDLARVEYNLELLRASLDPGCQLAAVLKANAYGLGAAPVAARLHAAGVGWFCVYSLAEARELAAALPAGEGCRVLVLGPVHDLSGTGLDDLLEVGSLHLVVHSTEHARALEATLPAGVVLPVHVEVDSGLHRCGLPPSELSTCLRHIHGSRRLRLAGLLSHAAAADRDGDRTREQLVTFHRAVAACGRLAAGVPLHFASTYALLRDRRLHLDMVRVGLALYGYGPGELHVPDASGRGHEVVQLLPAVRLESQVVHLIEVPEGAPVGYGGTFVAPRPMRLALVPVGYKHGYPRALASGSVAEVRGHHLPVVGAISMDQLSLDVTDHPEIQVGEPVTLVSDEPGSELGLEQLAQQANTNAHELLCRLSAAPQVHVG